MLGRAGGGDVEFDAGREGDSVQGEGGHFDTPLPLAGGVGGGRPASTCGSFRKREPTPSPSRKREGRGITDS
ncbi:hypothetical protein E2E30_18335 [Sphingomonas sp. AAP5]|nr:hypothetical protein E2E30_18335 [Sphingomonas sp. AAP5]